MVELTNGGFVRGTVLVYEPGQPVVVQLPNGTTRTLAASEVARVRMGDATQREPLPPPAAESPPPPPAQVSPAPPEPTRPPTEPAVSTAASPPSAEPQPAQATYPLSAPGLTNGVWRMNDGEGDRDAWPDLETTYRPHGLVRFGVAGGVGINHGFTLGLGTGARFDVAVLIDIRPAAWVPYRMRFEAVLGLMNNDPGMGVVSFLLRAHLAAIDLGDYLVWRVGGEIGGRYIDRVGTNGVNRTGFQSGPSTEFAVTLMERRLEVAALFSLPFIFFESTWWYSGLLVGFEATLRAIFIL